MPIVNVYGTHKSLKVIQPHIEKIRELVAHELTTEEALLDSTHISLRLITTQGCFLGSAEFEIFGHCFHTRVQNQDNICIKLRKEFDSCLGIEGYTRVWLILSNMGYSYLRIKDNR